MTATATETEQDVFTDLMGQLDTPYVILVLDDDKTTMEYVILVFMKHFKLDQETATKRMWEVHTEGQSTLDSGSWDEMKAHHEAMGHYRLRSKIEKAH